MLAETAAEYFFLAACVLVALGLLGLPLKLLLRLLAGERIGIPTPLLGIAVAVVGGWYAYGFGTGLRSVFQLGCVLGVLVAAACLVVRRRTLRADARDVARRLIQPAFVAGGTALVLVFSAGSIFSIQYPTVLTAGNNDVASYAMLGQHVADEGPNHAGPIAGDDLGVRSTVSFDFGPIAVVAAASAVGPFDDVWRYLMPLLGVAIGLVAYSVALCLDRVFPGRLLLTGLAAIASICPFLFQYLWSHFFLNQIVSIGVILVTCLVVTRGATRLQRTEPGCTRPWCRRIGRGARRLPTPTSSCSARSCSCPRCSSHRVYVTWVGASWRSLSKASRRCWLPSASCRHWPCALRSPFAT